MITGTIRPDVRRAPLERAGVAALVGLLVIILGYAATELVLGRRAEVAEQNLAYDLALADTTDDLTLAVAVAAILLMSRAIYAPFGYTLRAARDSSVRADAIGIDVRTHRWLAFVAAGAAAGLAGGLFAFSKGSIDPTLISIPMSIDFLVMILAAALAQFVFHLG